MNAKLLVEKLIDCFALLDNIDNKVDRFDRHITDLRADLHDLQKRVRKLELEQPDAFKQ